MNKVMSLVAASFTLGLQMASAEPVMEVCDRYLVGNELRLLVETERITQRFWEPHSKASRLRGWFVTVDLAKSGPLASRARVVGPLWATDDVHFRLGFSDDVRLTATDVAAGKGSPPTGFDDRGELIRQVRTAEGSLVVERCDTTKTPPVWTKESDASKMNKAGVGWVEADLWNQHARTRVQIASDGKTRAYDLFTGTAKDDPWLTEAFADLCGRADFQNTVTWLTDDVKYIVARPQDMHNVGGGKMIEQFVFDGRQYSRAEFGLVYTRPQTKPALFRKPASDAMFLFKPPQGAFSIDGELMLLEVADSSLRLFSPDGTTRFEWVKHDSLRWTAGNVPDKQLDAAAGRLVFFSFLRDPDDNNYGGDHEVVVVWDYKLGKLRREIVELSELFDVKDGAYEPKRVEK